MPRLYITQNGATATDKQGEAWLKRYSGKDVLLTVSGHSLPEHRLLFTYLNWIWNEYYRLEKYHDQDDFRDWVSVSVGHVKTTIMEVNGAQVVFTKPKSWSFAKCDHAQFHALTNAVNDLFERLHGVSIETFRQNTDEGKQSHIRSRHVPRIGQMKFKKTSGGIQQ